MLKIRLQRTGKRGQAYFKVVATEHTTRPQGKYLEFLGSYDPHKNKLSVEKDRVKYWLSKGAHLSETLNNLLVGKGIIEGEKVKVWKPKKKKGGQAETAEAGKTGEKAEKKEEVPVKSDEASVSAEESPKIG